MALVSVIIPHFNRSILLKDTIASVQQQTFSDWEVIIVDDGSGEAERKAINSFSNDQRIIVTDRIGGIKGPSSCRNQGVTLASGHYIIFLDSDDLLAPQCLQQRVEVMQQNLDVSMSVFLMENFREVPGDLKSFFNIDVPLEELADMFLKNTNPWQTMAPIWEKDFFIKAGGFDQELLFMEDPELHLRVVLKDIGRVKISYDKPVDCYYRLNNIDDTKKDFYRNSIYYRILFYKKIIHRYSDGILKNHERSLQTGIYSLMRNFLYARKNQFPDLYELLISVLKDSKLFSSITLMKIELLFNVGNSTSWLAKKLHFKGLCYKFLPV